MRLDRVSFVSIQLDVPGENYSLLAMVHRSVSDKAFIHAISLTMNLSASRRIASGPPSTPLPAPL